ncbi:hypothetical protein M406DRAFT_286930 [Cryphonectria parasitica EP155]|uniref:protein-tyrosine-phosphatase n=1 Tax=Cryphonectria parasitica (strain ATCC 38755 / EP155) TaxID=660469 RepID=A0A9P4Y9D5_CRYP1|nr:uncharacterized protein M406DRAFT_286930 [Cryphonectria parasitica EP155]KAF3768908.1 hypothetical protein M406DRAFT_286930 [Cryphonectria parasitica EP155]
MGPTKSSNLGQIIEYIPDRLYLASYIHPPTEDTLFPYPDGSIRSPGKRSQRAGQGPQAVQKPAYKQPYYFTVDDTLLYNNFHHDFGPFHIGHLYRFALQFHEILGADKNKDRPVVFWSRADPRSRANASTLLACYMVLIQSWPPHLALAPIAQVDPPLMPFRDAGYSQADYGITVQDVVYGVWKAKEEGVCALENFDLDEYERFERVEHGDFNWITPNFLAFASPQHEPVAKIPETSELWATVPKTLAAVDAHPTLPQPFKNVLKHFSERNIGLVVRLNSELYSPSYFEGLGITHLDLIFEDGTCPAMPTVRKFIRLAHEMITVKKRGIAVHCKAGLGRTGCLIGAYLIYRYGFTADEVIGYMRFMRPGMVVGPQQHWLHLNQGVFREWWVEERIERRLRKEMAAAAAAAANANANPSTPVRTIHKANIGRSPSKTSTPSRSASNRTPLGEVENDRTNITADQENYLPAPTPGQPRKTRHYPPSSRGIPRAAMEESCAVQEDVEIMSVKKRSSANNGDSDEEMQMRVRTGRRSSVSPNSGKSRSVSHTTTTTSIYTSLIDDDASNDVENIGSSLNSKAKGAKPPLRSTSAGGVLTKVRGSSRGPDGKGPSGVRKTSGRVGSMTSPTAAAANTARKISGAI